MEKGTLHTPDNTFSPLEDTPYVLTDRQQERIQQVAHLLPLMQGTVVLLRLERTRRLLGGQYRRFCVRSVLRSWFGLEATDDFIWEVPQREQEGQELKHVHATLHTSRQSLPCSSR